MGKITFMFLVMFLLSFIVILGQCQDQSISSTTTTTTTTGRTIEPTKTTTTTESPNETSTTTTFSILSDFEAQPDISDIAQGTRITIFSDRTTSTDYQNLYVEISSLYGEESTLGLTYYDLKPLSNGLNLANPIKDGVIDFSVDEGVDIDYDNIDVLANDGNINFIDSQNFPIYKYGQYRELPSFYNDQPNEKYIEDIANILPTTVDTTIELIKLTKNVPIPIVSQLIEAISIAPDTRKALDDIGWLPHLTIGDNVDETEKMTKRYSNILNERDIVEVQWNSESDLILLSKAYESVVIKIPLRINDPENKVVYIHGIYICESPTPDSGRSSTVNFYSKIELPSASGTDETLSSSELEIVTFPDQNLEAEIREAINKREGDIYAADLEEITSLEPTYKNIENIFGLEYCSNLKKLDLRGNAITDISPLSGLNNLENLSLDVYKITDLSPLSGLKNLKILLIEENFLDLKTNNITNIFPLSRLTTLKTLRIWNAKITDISPLSGLTSLKDLELMNNGQINDISPLSDLINLENLSISLLKVIDISPLSGLTNLKKLSLDGNQITDISPLSGLTNLQTLDLHLNQITDVSPLSELASLNELNLNHNQITDISPLSGLTNLKELYLGSNQITDVSPLSGLTCEVIK